MSDDAITITTTTHRAKALRIALMDRINGVRPWAKMASETDSRRAPELLAFLMATLEDVDRALAGAPVEPAADLVAVMP